MLFRTFLMLVFILLDSSPCCQPSTKTVAAAHIDTEIQQATHLLRVGGSAPHINSPHPRRGSRAWWDPGLKKLFTMLLGSERRCQVAKHLLFYNKKWKGIISEKDKNENLLCWQGLVLLDRSWQVRTWPNHDFWSNFAEFGFKAEFLTKWFCMVLPGEAQKHVFLIKNHNIW